MFDGASQDRIRAGCHGKHSYCWRVDISMAPSIKDGMWGNKISTRWLFATNLVSANVCAVVLPCCAFAGLGEVRYANDERYKWQYVPPDHLQGQAKPARLPTHKRTPDTCTSLNSPFLSSCNTSRTNSEIRCLLRCGARKQFDDIIQSRHYDSTVRAGIRDYNCTIDSNI